MKFAAWALSTKQSGTRACQLPSFLTTALSAASNAARKGASPATARVVTEASRSATSRACSSWIHGSANSIDATRPYSTPGAEKKSVIVRLYTFNKSAEIKAEVEKISVSTHARCLVATAFKGLHHGKIGSAPSSGLSLNPDRLGTTLLVRSTCTSYPSPPIGWPSTRLVVTWLICSLGSHSWLTSAWQARTLPGISQNPGGDFSCHSLAASDTLKGTKRQSLR